MYVSGKNRYCRHFQNTTEVAIPHPRQIQQEHPLQGAPPMLINKSDSLSLAFVNHVSASCVMVAYIK